MDLYKEILIKALGQQKMQITFPDLKMDINEILELHSYQALQKIKAIINDDSLTDSWVLYENRRNYLCIWRTGQQQRKPPRFRVISCLEWYLPLHDFWLHKKLWVPLQNKISTHFANSLLFLLPTSSRIKVQGIIPCCGNAAAYLPRVKRNFCSLPLAERLCTVLALPKSRHSIRREVQTPSVNRKYSVFPIHEMSLNVLLFIWYC